MWDGGLDRESRGKPAGFRVGTPGKNAECVRLAVMCLYGNACDTAQLFRLLGSARFEMVTGLSYTGCASKILMTSVKK
jgi:hypothetical protein